MTTTDTLKYKLLQTKQIINNNYLERYVELVISRGSTKDINYTEQHHIIPFSYYAHQLNIITKKDKANLRRRCLKKITDEYKLITENNIAYLTFYEHCLAHYYLYKCSILELKIDSEKAFIKMTGRDLNLRNCSEAEVTALLTYLQSLRDDPESDSFKSRQVDQIITEYYAIGGYKQCLQVLKETYGIICTKNSIKARAKKLNIRGAKYTPDWTESELDIIKEYYALYGYKKCLSLLPGRTKYSIQTRARYLGITAPGASKANAS